MKTITFFAKIRFIFLLIQSCHSESSAPFQGKPSNTIDANRAEVLQKTWVETRAIPIENALGKEDTREFNIPLENLEHYIHYVKEEAKKRNVNYADLGIRVYYGAYPQGDTSQGSDPGFATIFLAPTAIDYSPNGKNQLQPNSFWPQKTAGNEYENMRDIDNLNILTGGKPPRNY